jgi:hypothetical protein
MRKRPWEVILLTVLYAAAPIFNVGHTMVARQVELANVFYVLMDFDFWDWAGLVADFLLAWAVWSVSRPGWWIFLVLNAFLFCLNVWQTSQVPGANLLAAAAANAIIIAVASLLFTKHARSPYFSPRSRWWNSQTRFRLSDILEVPVTIKQDAQEGKGLMVDVSLTGCFAEVKGSFDPDHEVELEFACWGLALRSRGRIMRRSGSDDQPQGYGIQFLGKDAEHRHSFRALVQTLKAHHVPILD